MTSGTISLSTPKLKHSEHSLMRTTPSFLYNNNPTNIHSDSNPNQNCIAKEIKGKRSVLLVLVYGGRSHFVDKSVDYPFVVRTLVTV